MAIVRIPDENRTLREKEEITDYLASIGINYERWDLPQAVDDDASPEQILAIYHEQIEHLKQQGGYVTADVIDVNPATPNLEACWRNSAANIGTMKTRYVLSSAVMGCFIFTRAKTRLRQLRWSRAT